MLLKHIEMGNIYIIHIEMDDTRRGGEHWQISKDFEVQVK